MEEAQNTQRQEEAENQEVLEILIINDKCVLTRVLETFSIKYQLCVYYKL